MQVATVNPEQSLDQIQSCDYGVSFLQGGKLYHLDTNIVNIKLKYSKIAGRDHFITFVSLSDKKFIMISADFCVSILEFGEKSYALTFLCPYCGHLFKEWHHLHTCHIHLHKGPVACAKCGVPKIDEEQLKKHKQSCKFVCTDCGNQFTREAAFMKHKSVH